MAPLFNGGPLACPTPSADQRGVFGVKRGAAGERPAASKAAEASGRTHGLGLRPTGKRHQAQGTR